mgnify:FL=1
MVYSYCNRESLTQGAGNMNKIERLIERSHIERRRDGAIRDAAPRIRYSSHSEAAYWTHKNMTVRLAAHPRTVLGADCGHDEPDLDIVIGDAQKWDISRNASYRAPHVWLNGYKSAGLRRALAETLKRIRG